MVCASAFLWARWDGASRPLCEAACLSETTSYRAVAVSDCRSTACPESAESRRCNQPSNQRRKDQSRGTDDPPNAQSRPKCKDSLSRTFPVACLRTGENVQQISVAIGILRFTPLRRIAFQRG